MRTEDCLTCMDAGVLEVTDGAVKTLALCYCKQGKKQRWQLETIPIAGFKHQALDWREYKPTKQISYQEKINWHLERVRNAESFWMEQRDSAATETKKGDE